MSALFRSKFQFSIIILVREDSAANQMANALLDFSKLSVLVVDDSRHMRDVIKAVLGSVRTNRLEPGWEVP